MVAGEVQACAAGGGDLERVGADAADRGERGHQPRLAFGAVAAGFVDQHGQPLFGDAAGGFDFFLDRAARLAQPQRGAGE
ncbi:hypothetical protein [Thauera sp. SDU_THAU2]|uniref:hypothetical protein n=1 Tax=Thauera sp. SDU_THAU2 TaxID=3136633 RepID=UPI00311F2649